MSNVRALRDSPVTHKGEVYFAFYAEDFDPNEVTRIVGLDPTSARRRGSPIPKHTWWRVSAGSVEGEDVDIYEMASNLVERLAPHKQELLEAKHRLRLEAVLAVVLHVSMDDSASTPAMGFTTQVISFLSAVGASVDIDIYRNVL